MTPDTTATPRRADPSIPLIYSKSTIFQKVPPDLRAQIDRAIINHDPPTYRAIFEQFDLASLSVSFTSLYLYGRKLRRHALLADKAGAIEPLTPASTATTVSLLNAHLQEVLTDDEPNDLKVKRLSDAWRGALLAHLKHDVHHTAVLAKDAAVHTSVVQGAFKRMKDMLEAGLEEALERRNAKQAADSARVRTAIKDGLAAMTSLVSRHSPTGKPTDAATKAAARHVDISLPAEVRSRIERVIEAPPTAGEATWLGPDCRCFGSGWCLPTFGATARRIIFFRTYASTPHYVSPTFAQPALLVLEGGFCSADFLRYQH